MNTQELKTLRKGMAMTQAGLANAIGLSRKTINEMENGAPIEPRTELAVRALASRVKLVEDTFWVERSKANTWIVARRTVRELPHHQEMYFAKSELMLYGEFDRREDAYRWSAALRLADNPRNTRKLQRQRALEAAERSATEAVGTLEPAT